jgi:transcriptional regulator with XRE-family HTH domain
MNGPAISDGVSPHERCCDGCNTHLAQDNRSNRCGPCSRERRPPDDRPTPVPDLWQQAEIRRAIAAKHIGQVFRAFRRCHMPVLTQEALAARLQLTQAQVSNLEKGARGTTDLERLERWCGVLEMPRHLWWFAQFADLERQTARSPSDDHSASNRNARWSGPDATAAGTSEPFDVRRMVAESAHQSAKFGQWADSLSVGDFALTVLRLRVEQLATAYVHAPMVPIFLELKSLRDELFGMLRAPDAAQARDLYLLAGITCGLLAHASGNFGDLRAANVQALTAMICATKADHPTLAAWILGVRALQCEWGGDPEESLRFVGRAYEQTRREHRPSTVAPWLDAIEARAQARLGRGADAVRAIERAIDGRGRLPITPGNRNEFDEIGGILTFPDAKQLFYAGTAYRRVGQMDAARDCASSAIAAYVDGPIEERSYGDEAIARVDLAIARAGGQKPDLDGAAEALENLADLPPDMRLPTLLGPLADLSAAISAPKFARARIARDLRDGIGRIVSTCQSNTAEIRA